MSAWATTERGDIFVHEPECNQTPNVDKAAFMLVQDLQSYKWI